MYAYRPILTPHLFLWIRLHFATFIHNDSDAVILQPTSIGILGLDVLLSP